MKVLLDVNVILDVLLKRPEWQADAETIWRAGQTDQLDCCVAASSLTDIFYIARRLVGRDRARAAVGECLDALTVLPVDGAVLDAAFARPEPDFEDAVLIIVAESNSVDAIVTRDQSGFSHSSIEALSPNKVAARLSASESS